MDREVNLLLAAMREAGRAVLHLQEHGFTQTKKANNDIVTQADLLVNDILQSRLLGEFKNDGWLSEESVDDAHRLTCQRVWVVDPIDGTREFATGIPEYAISVALIEAGEPILAAVFNPSTDELFHAIKGKGAWQSDRKIECLITNQHELLLLASRSEYKRGEWTRFEKASQVKQVGSIAYKLALIAAGKAHATFSLSPKNEWDIAAGVLLVQEAKGIVTDKTRKPFQFNRAVVKVNGIVATAAVVSDQVYALIEGG